MPSTGREKTFAYLCIELLPLVLKKQTRKTMAYERLLDKQNAPTEQDIITTLGNSSDLWLELHHFIETHYDLNKELAFFSKNYGWTVRYRKSKKTLISCFPEHGAFSALFVVGKAEADKINLVREELNQNFLTVFDNTEQLRDGRWMWIRILNEQDLADLIKVIQIKRKPNAKKS